MPSGFGRFPAVQKMFSTKHRSRQRKSHYVIRSESSSNKIVRK
jgi:hypothetical protein